MYINVMNKDIRYDLALKWNNIYWIEIVTPNSSLFPTTYNLKVNHSNNIISLFTTLT